MSKPTKTAEPFRVGHCETCHGFVYVVGEENVTRYLDTGKCWCRHHAPQERP